MGAGWDNSCFVVDDHWVFRFPKRDDVVPHLRTEAAVLPLLDLPLPIPDVQWVGEPTDAFGFPFLGYRVLRGTPLDQTQLEASGILAQILPFLDALHATAIRGPIADVRGWEAPFEASLEAVGKLERTASVQRALEWLQRREPPRGRCLVHDDLGPEHILVDPDLGRITGIIDWGDMDLRTPGADLVGLWGWKPDAVEAAAPEGLYDARTIAVLYSLFDLRNKRTWGTPTEVDVADRKLCDRLDRVGAS